MLKSLYISSFVIIDELRIDFQENMSTLTGETGAGKSIIIDALGQICGNRANTSLIQKGSSKAIIEGTFDVIHSVELDSLFNELHLDIEDEIVITKEIYDTGKSTVKINYQSATNQALKLIMPYMIDIHSQFETQNMFKEKNHIHLFNEYTSKETHDLFSKYSDEYLLFKDLKKQYQQLLEEDLSDEQLEFLESQLQEIESAPYSDEEVEELEKELQALENFEKMNEHIRDYDARMNSTQGALPLMNEALSSLEKLTDQPDFNQLYDQLYNEYYEIIDKHEEVLNLFHSYSFDEYRFNELQDIIYNINRLKRKYGFSMESIEIKKNEIIEKIEHIQNREEVLIKKQNELKEQENKCLNIAQKISHIRKEKAITFTKQVQSELADLYLDKAKFQVEFEESELTSQGIDKIHFMISTNVGQSLSILNETASGGEMSRIMLAIKIIILSYNQVETIIFDEVDAGVSGKVASSIGQKMYQLALEKQVICITHLPQVASYANHHYHIEKTSNESVTQTSVHLLDEEQRIHEIATMLSGEEITEEAISNAKTLLYKQEA